MLQKLEDIRRRYEEIKARLGNPDFVPDPRAVRDRPRKLWEFEPIVAKIEERSRIARELQGARELTDSLPPGDEMYQMASAERAALLAQLDRIDEDLKVLLLPKDP